MSTYTFENFEYVDGDIVIPANTIFYRGLPKNTKDYLRDQPLYISSLNIAKHYGEVHEYKTQKSLTIIDFRKLRNLVNMIISSRSSNTGEILQVIRYLTIAFGLGSYYNQVNMLEQYVKDVELLVIDKNELNKVRSNIESMKRESSNIQQILNPFDPQGVRVAETYIDGKVMLFLREIFDGIYDGFIAPRLYSPFHTNNNTHEEIIIFNPIKSQIQHNGLVKTDVRTINLSDELRKYKVKIFKTKDFYRKIYETGGTISKPYKTGGAFDIIDHDKFYDDEKEVKKSKRQARKFIKHINLKEFIIPAGYIVHLNLDV